VLPALGVTVGATSELVTTVEQGMFVLPQTTAGDLSVPLNSATDFYLEVAYSLDGKAQTPASIRFADINGVANQSVTFEIGRQYVLNLTFGGTGGGVQVGAQITFGDIDADTYPEPPIPVPGKWAASNIYFLPETPGGFVGKLTFSESDKLKTGYQGLFFKWGSLIGVAAGDDGLFDQDTYLYIPDVATEKYYKVKVSEVTSSYTNGTYPDMEAAVQAFATAAGDFTTGGSTDWAKIPYVDYNLIGAALPVDERNDNRLTTLSGTATIPYATYKGDVCKFISSGSTSALGGSWIMPTSAMLPGSGTQTSLPYTADSYVWNLVPNWTGTGAFSSIDPDGVGSSDDSGVILKGAGGDLVFRFPASGLRAPDNGELVERGLICSFYTSSIESTTYVVSPGNSNVVYSLVSMNGQIRVEGTVSDHNAMSVRCVRE
jgi:hypothetical protein